MIIIDVPTIMKKRTNIMIEKICEICGKKYLGSEKPNSSKICRSCVQKNANNKRRSTMIKNMVLTITSDLKRNIKYILFLNLFLFQRPCLTCQVLLDLQRR